MRKQGKTRGAAQGGESAGRLDPLAKRGEEGFFERKTDEAHEACMAFPDAEAFTAAAEEYFRDCDARDVLYGEAGLCVALSKHSANGRPVTVRALQNWWDGEKCPHLQEAVQLAYLRIQSQIETDPRYQEKGGMTTRAIFLLKQKRFGGYTDKVEQKTEAKVTISYQGTMDESDFE